MIVYPAVGIVESRAAKILVNSEVKRQVDLHPEAMMVWIDFNHPKLQMKDSKAGLAADRLSDDCRPRRIDAGNAHINYTSPSGRVRE
jgi:hypothetical protein